MQRNIKSLIDRTLDAIDGEIGKVKEFYFDDKTWAVRYLVLKTGSWLFGREVLISPVSVVKNPWSQGTVPVNLIKQQIRTSPDIDTDRTVSRQKEIELYAHYQLQPYWGPSFYPGGGFWNMTNQDPVAEEPIKKEQENMDKSSDDDLHLRSTRAVTGYHIHASNGAIGHITDFIMDDQTWELLFVVVDTHNWVGGKKVLIPVVHIENLQWESSIIEVDMSVEAVKDCTTYEETKFNQTMKSIPHL